MIPLDIRANIEQTPWDDCKSDVKELGLIARIGRLPKGTKQGNSTVAIVIEMSDGTKVVGETTLALMVNAVRFLENVDKLEKESEQEKN